MAYAGVPARDVIQKARDLGIMPKKLAMIAKVHEASIYRWEKMDKGAREPITRIRKYIDNIEKLGIPAETSESEETVNLENGATDVIVEAQMLGMTMRDIGRAAGVSQSTISAWKKNNAGEPRPLEKLREVIYDMKQQREGKSSGNGSNGTKGHFADRLTHRLDLSNVQVTDPKEKKEDPVAAEPPPQPETQLEAPAPVVEIPVEEAPAPETPTETVLYLCRLDNGPMVSDPSLVDGVMKVISRYNNGSPISAVTAEEMLRLIQFTPLGYGTTSVDEWKPVADRLQVHTTWELQEK